METDKTIRELQTSLPWTIRYSRDYRANPQPHKDFTHALIHVAKAAMAMDAFIKTGGKLSVVRR